MNNNKTSIVLSAIDKFSQPVNTAVKSVGKLQSKVAETSSTLSELNKKQQLVARFKGLESRLEDTRGELSKARTEVVRLKDSEAQASDIVRRHTRSLKLAEQAVLEAAHSYGAESEQVAAARREVIRLTKAKRQAEQAHKREQAALKTAEQAASRLTAEYGQQSQKLGSLRNDLTSAGLKLNSLGAEQLRLARQTDKANQALEQQEAKLKRIQSLNGRIAERNAQKGELVGQAMETAAMVAPMVLAGKRAVEYESTFADVKKVVNFKDEKEEAEYRTKMMKLAGDLGMRQEGIAQIVTAAGQSGIEKTELLKFAESATKMSVAWDVSAEEAGSTLATWRAAMGLTQENALDLADSTNYLSNNMNAKAKDIAAVMVRQGSTAMGAGLNYNQTAALSASLIAGGATEEVAATALKNITGRLTAGYAATNGQKEAMGKLGFNADELASMMQEDAQGTLVQVMRQLQDVDAAERGAVISQLFGEEVKGAVAKLVTTLDDDKNGLIAAFGRVEKQADRAGSVNDEYANRAKTRSHTLSQLSAKFDRMMVVLGDRLLPVIDAVVPPLMTVVDGISNFAEANPKLASGLLAVAGAIAVVKAGAIAFKLARLAMGNGLDRLRLGREQLSGVTNNTALNARKATNELSRFNRELNSVGSRRGRSGGYESNRRRRGRSSGRRSGGRFGRLVGGITDLFGGASLPAQSLAGRDDYRPARRARGGKWGRMAALLGGGTALSVMSANANAGELAMTGAAVAGTAGDLFNALPIGGALLGGVGKLFRPLDIALSGAALTSAIANGDGKQIGGTAGDMIGGLGGAAAGAMAGAAIGSVVPVIGTAVGGVIGSVVGGIGGGELGQWLGETVGGWFGGGDESPEKQAGKPTQPIVVVKTDQGKAEPVLSGRQVTNSQSVINESESSIVNHLGGAAAGAMAGAAIGSVVPVIGTAVGGVIGSVVGAVTGSGSWVSEQVQNWFGDDKTDKPAPASVAEQSKQLVNSNRQISFAPVIQIQPSGNPEYDKGVANQLLERMKAELVPVMFGGSDVSVRADASLSDRRDT